MSPKKAAVDPVLVAGWRGAHQLTAIGISTLKNLARDGKFPKPFRLTSGLIGWRKATLMDWIRSREQEST